eukprot:61159-Lingulodinium_polyedra.AAC.1
MLPKPAGGERAVVLLPVLHVAWSTAWACEVRSWDEGMARHWDSVIKGSSALRAGLMRRLLD